mmetsp:Transcript_11314/g.38697  ORF Transcript_11314/g.38697 Transcript_11314/m.38697 type:complete len:229 (-) Transcript_11314:1344-2030(-)
MRGEERRRRRRRRQRREGGEERRGGGALNSLQALLHEDHKRLRKDFSNMRRDRRQLEQDEHSTVDVRGAKGAKRAEKMYDNDEPSSSSHRRHASHSGALTSGKVKMIMAGLCGVLLVLLGILVLFRQSRSSRSSNAAESGDRIPLRQGDPRSIPVKVNSPAPSRLIPCIAEAHDLVAPRPLLDFELRKQLGAGGRIGLDGSGSSNGVRLTQDFCCPGRWHATRLTSLR